MMLRTWGARIGMLILTAVGLTLTMAPNALAHNELVSSNPSDGEVLVAMPTTVELVFEQVIDAAHADVAISDGNGGILDVTVVVDGTTARATVKEPPAVEADPTSWQVGYRMLSADGHSVEGNVQFVVDGPDIPAGGSASTPASEVPTSVVSSADSSSATTTTMAAGEGDGAATTEISATAITSSDPAGENAPTANSESTPVLGTLEPTEVVTAASATPSTESSSAWIWILAIAAAFIGIAAALRFRRSAAAGSK